MKFLATCLAASTSFISINASAQSDLSMDAIVDSAIANNDADTLTRMTLVFGF